MEVTQFKSVDLIKSSVRYFLHSTQLNIHLMKAGCHKTDKVVITATKMRTVLLL